MNAPGQAQLKVYVSVGMSVVAAIWIALCFVVDFWGVTVADGGSVEGKIDRGEIEQFALAEGADIEPTSSGFVLSKSGSSGIYSFSAQVRFSEHQAMSEVKGVEVDPSIWYSSVSGRYEYRVKSWWLKPLGFVYDPPEEDREFIQRFQDYVDWPWVD